MKSKGLTFDDVLEIGLTLPNTTAGTAWGSPCLHVNGNRRRNGRALQARVTPAIAPGQWPAERGYVSLLR